MQNFPKLKTKKTFKSIWEILKNSNVCQAEINR